METKEITNSEVVEEKVEETANDAVEETTDVNSGNAAMIAAVFGAGVLAGTVICKFVAPIIGRKIKGVRKYVTVKFKEVKEEKADETETPPAEEKDEETGEKAPKA